MELFLNILFLLIGFVLLIKGADFFVEGSSQIAKYFKIPTLVIGLTLVSIGTSLPEISVSVSSAIANKTDLSFGNVIGSNIFNILVVLGLCATIKQIVVPKDAIKFDIPIYLGIIVVLVLFAFVFTPYQIVWYEALILFLIFLGYMTFIILRSRKDIKNSEPEEYCPARKMIWNVLFVIGGAVAIIFGGDFVVDSAAEIARAFNMSELLVGLTIIAVGTSLPELVTSMVAAKKGEVDIAVGNAVGSCIFNIVLILGLSGMISPIGIQQLAYIDLIIMTVAIVLTFVFSFKSKKINRWQGLILVAIYIGYLTYIILRA